MSDFGDRVIASFYDVDCMIGNRLMMMTDDEIRDAAAADVQEVSIAWERH